MKKILVCVPTYNEKGNIKILCEEIFKIKKKIDLLFVDDNSPDGTAEIIKKLKSIYKNIFLIKRSSKLGIGSALRRGFDFALEKKYDAIITLDADLSHDPKKIPLFIKKLKKYDFVIGSRYVKGGLSDYTGFRNFISRYANKLCKYILNMPFNEFTTSYRIYNCKCLKILKKMNLKSEDYSCLIEFFFYIYYSGLRCSEIPIHFRDRYEGKSKISKFQIIYGLFKLLSLYIKKKNKDLIK